LSSTIFHNFAQHHYKENHFEMPLSQVDNIILVLSGKGGVGKSSVTTQLALTLSLRGYNVGVLDLDITGPNAPRFFGVEDKKVLAVPGGIGAVPIHEALPAAAEGSRAKRGALSVMSLGFILPSRSTAVIWRGPKKTAMVRQFLTQTAWPGHVDIMLIDTPPGTSDEHISLMETLHLETAAPNSPFLAGAVLVTTPQAVATADVRKELSFCEKTAIPVLGVLENMAGFVCPHCAECTDLFSRGGGEVMAQEYGVEFLGRCPIDPMFGRLIEEGLVPEYPDGTVVGGHDFAGKREASGTELKLVEKYEFCSLKGIFDGVVGKLVNKLRK
jgi:Mrp family chromosome partitioning ATPase